ncbi:hypothetical protein [Vibrio crassostreae]|nr:hypothetical protein [Vibrio crassostreae]
MTDLAIIAATPESTHFYVSLQVAAVIATWVVLAINFGNGEDTEDD